MKSNYRHLLVCCILILPGCRNSKTKTAETDTNSSSEDATGQKGQDDASTQKVESADSPQSAAELAHIKKARAEALPAPTPPGEAVTFAVLPTCDLRSADHLSTCLTPKEIKSVMNHARDGAERAESKEGLNNIQIKTVAASDGTTLSFVEFDLLGPFKETGQKGCRLLVQSGSPGGASIASSCSGALLRHKFVDVVGDTTPELALWRTEEPSGNEKGLHIYGSHPSGGRWRNILSESRGRSCEGDALTTIHLDRELVELRCAPPSAPQNQKLLQRFEWRKVMFVDVSDALEAAIDTFLDDAMPVKKALVYARSLEDIYPDKGKRRRIGRAAAMRSDRLQNAGDLHGAADFLVLSADMDEIESFARYHAAGMYATLGEVERAVSQLQILKDGRDSTTLARALEDEKFAKIRGEASFKALYKDL